MIMWYPKPVFARAVMGLSTVDGVSWNAASWKAPTMVPRVIHPKLPPAIRRDQRKRRPFEGTMYL